VAPKKKRGLVLDLVYQHSESHGEKAVPDSHDGVLILRRAVAK
jgi:hypothetical protein